MRQKEIELLLSYFVNEEIRLDNQITELRARIRFRNITLEDNIEMILLQQKIDDFREFRQNCMQLLHLNCN